jgi:hypothetical protein
MLHLKKSVVLTLTVFAAITVSANALVTMPVYYFTRGSVLASVIIAAV